MPLSDPKTRQAIGYCPQTDPVSPTFSLLLFSNRASWAHNCIFKYCEVYRPSYHPFELGSTFSAAILLIAS